MGSFSRNFGDILQSANQIATTMDKQFQEQARLSTQTKELQLQTDINEELAKIRQSANDEEWNTQINDFFTRVKSGMSNKNSPYYCRNNLQAQQFEAIMEQHRVGVSAKVGQMAEQRQSQKRIADVQTAKQNAKQLHHGADLLNIYNELDRSLYESGDLNPLEYQQQKEMNYKNVYVDAKLTVFEKSKADAIKQGKTFEEFKSDFDKVNFNLQHTDIKGLPTEFDKTALDQQIDKTIEQSYNAALRDLQDQNGLKLANIEKQMLQQDTWEKRLAVAREGQMFLNFFEGLQLDERRTEHYAAVFDLILKGGKSGSGNGSGSGSGSKPTDSFDKLLKNGPDDAIDIVIKGKANNWYDGSGKIVEGLENFWLYGNFKENADKNYEERKDTWDMFYAADASKENIDDAVYKRILERYPTFEAKLGNKYKGLIADMKKDPKKYGTAQVQDLARFATDLIMGSNPNTDEKELLDQFDKYINDCYVSKIKYVTLNNKGELLKTFDAKSPAGIAQAAKFVREHDFVYDYNGKQYWGEGKEAALTADGGAVSTLMSAVAGTFDIPEEDIKAGKIGFFWKPNEKNNDVDSIPIITYKNKAWKVIPTEDNKGFYLQNYHNPDEKIEGKIPNRKMERDEGKKLAGDKVKELSEVRKQIESSREVDDAQWADILYDKSMPKAAATTGATNAEDWNQSDKYTRITMLTSTARRVTKDAHKVEANKMSEDDFKKKYGFDYSTWTQASTRDKQFYTLLNN